jgi:tetratricopeptide (TPR) repeat protein
VTSEIWDPTRTWPLADDATYRNLRFPSFARAVKARSRKTDFAVCAFLFAIVWAIFGRTFSNEFVDYDDHEYVFDNSVVQRGLTWSGIKWAFTTTRSANWHPLTWISHMIDCQLFGLNAGAHHLMNVGIHAANSALLFLALRQLVGSRDRTEDFWRSAFVAALFALHPLHVESVAWASERKDVLSALFWILTLLAYGAYVRRATAGRYILVLALFALGLMAKPMLVTLPFILLLLDYWPLGRTVSWPTIQQTKRACSAWRLIAEKIPFLILSIISSVVTLFAQSSTIAPLNALSLWSRLTGAVISYSEYVIKIVWPIRLAVFYPLKSTASMLEVTAAAGFLAAVTLLAIWVARRVPYILVGWLWYLVTLLPVIGLIQVGFQSMADRYTYIPSIGLFISVTWGAADLVKNTRLHKFLFIPATAVLMACLVMTWRQLGYWQNSITLFNHALAVTTANYVAHNTLGDVLLRDQKVEEAKRHYLEAIRIKPDYDDPHRNLGDALMRQNRIEEAIGHYAAAVQIAPDSIVNRSSLGDAFIQEGKISEGVACYAQAMRLRPDLARTHFQLAKGLILLGNAPEAIKEFRDALRLWPDRIEVLKNLAWILATNPNPAVRNGNEAVQLAERVCNLTGKNDAEALDILAAAYAETGRYEDAVNAEEKALTIAKSSQSDAVIRDMRDRVELYKLSLPYHARK